MVANIGERVGMSLDEFLRRQIESPFELIDGEVIQLVTPKAFGSDECAWLLHIALLNYGGNGKKGFAYVETTFVLPDTPDDNWVKGSRQPDVLYIAKDRLETYRASTSDWRRKPLMLVPDLAIEVVSPTDRLPKVWRKASIYLEDGVKLVWVINPMRKTATTFAENEAPYTLEQTGVLTGGAVLPGFSLSLAPLFAD